ncbi:BTH_I0359 family protein [Saezia sanguinis]|nr:DUF3567 family protein [Saezia sanguinis]
MMQLLYNSENFSVIAVALTEQNQPQEVQRGGYEIVNKLTGKGIYLEGDLARKFQREVQQIAEQSDEQGDLEDYLQNYDELMHRVVQN